MRWDASQVCRGRSPLERCPHFPVALSCPDDRPVDAARFVIGARYAERQTMLVDRKGLKFRVQSQTDEVKRIFQRSALRDALLHRVVERGNEVRGPSDALGNRL